MIEGHRDKDEKVRKKHKNSFTDFGIGNSLYWLR